MTTPSPALIRETFPVGPLQCNCTIIGDPITKKAIVVDPGGNPDLIMARLDAHGLKVVSIIHTHAHLDHFLASGQMKEKPVRPCICTRKTSSFGTIWRCSARCSACLTPRCRRRIAG